MRLTDSLWCDECGQRSDVVVLFGREEEVALCDECIREAMVKVMMPRIEK